MTKPIESGHSVDRNVERARALDTAAISDALDRLQIAGQCWSLSARGMTSGMAGRAFTVRYVPAAKPAGTVGDYIDDVAAGGVIALDNGGREDVTVWGDLLTEMAHRRRIAGTVIDGICRDVRRCRELDYPLYSCGHWMRTGKDRVQVEAVNQPVTIGRVRVAPLDLVRGDADGVVVVPREHEEAVLAAAEEIEAAEMRIRAAIRGGHRLDEARRAARYHQLQSKE
jgi:regulator of RNase E activity RraA